MDSTAEALMAFRAVASREGRRSALQRSIDPDLNHR
jgi:hypothetical protein